VAAPAVPLPQPVEFWSATPTRELADGCRAVLPLVAFLLMTLRYILATKLAKVAPAALRILCSAPRPP
jgi:hypothetical protein